MINKIKYGVITLFSFVFLFVLVGAAAASVTFQTTTGPTGTLKYNTFFSATTTTATSTNTTDGSGALVIAGAKKITMFFSRGGTVQANTGSTVFKVQASPDGLTWVDFGKLMQATSTTEQPNATISAATSTLSYGLDIVNDAFYAIRCIAVETTDGEHTCKASVEY